MHRVFDLLAENPRLGPERPEVLPGLRVHAYGSHLILYVRDENDDVLVVRVRDAREDWTHAPV